MWLCILIGLNFITEGLGFSGAPFPESCASMLPLHDDRQGNFYVPQRTEPPYVIHYEQGTKEEPITVTLEGKNFTEFKGFMLEARERGMVDEGRPVGKFIRLDPHETQLMACNGLADTSVIQVNNQGKTVIKVNWTAQGADLDVTFRATFLQSYRTFWDKVDVNVTFTGSEMSTPKPSTAKSTTESPTETFTTKLTTPKPSTAKSTTESPTETFTTKLTTPKPSTAKSTTESPTETFTTKLTTPKPSTAKSTTGSPTETYTTKLTPTTTPDNSLTFEERSVMLMCTNGFVEILNLMAVLLNSYTCVAVDKWFNISSSVLCAVLEVTALVLIFVGDNYDVTLAALIGVVTAINIIELVIASLPLICNKLKERCDITGAVCSLLQVILTVAILYIGVLKLDGCGQRMESWPLLVLITYTLWILLLLVWAVIFRETILGELEKREQEEKGDFCAAAASVVVVPVIIVIGALSFTVALLVGIATC